MKILELEQGTEEWHAARLGKLTGTKAHGAITDGLPLKGDVLKKLEATDIEFKKTWTVGTLFDLLPDEDQEELMRTMPKKIGFYEILAEKVAYQPEDGDPKPIDRGVELEPIAREKVAEKLGEKVEEVGICVSDLHDDIAVSPDGIIRKKTKGKEHIYYAVEIKCLSTARHLQALIEDRIPTDYKHQVLQYFVVLEELEVLYFCFYDPRIVGHELVIKEVHRDEVAEEVEAYGQAQLAALKELDEWAVKLSNF